MRLLSSITLRYFLVGLIVLATDYGILNLALYLGASLIISATWGFIAGTIMGFIFHNRFTFRDTTEDSSQESKKFLKFIFVALIGLILTDVIIYIFTVTLHLHHNLAKMIAVIASVLWAYSASRLWIFTSWKKIPPSAGTVKRILVFSPYYPPHIGGLESHSDEFNKYLSQKGLTIVVFTPHIPNQAPTSEWRYENVRVIRFPAIELMHNYPFPKFWHRDFWLQWEALHLEQYDIVISRTRFFFTSLMAWRYHAKANLPWIHIEHGSDFAQFKNPLLTGLGILYDKLIGSAVLKASTYNVANSLASSHFVSSLSGRNCAIIYRGVEQDIISSVNAKMAEREKFGDKIIIGFIGRLISGKGIADLLKALTKVPIASTVCLIIGDGPERQPLEKFARENNLSNVVFLGNQPFTEAIGYLKIFDIFVNPSYTEGIPTAVIEAAFCQKAIIATSVGGTKEVISGKQDGFLVTARDIPALSEKLMLLIENPDLRQKYGKNAFIAVQQRFEWQKAADQYLEIFNTKKI